MKYEIETLTDENLSRQVAEYCDTDLKYSKDLNACAFMEKFLSIDEQFIYGDHLREISFNVGPRGGNHPINGWGCYFLARVDARRRAEAFLLTKRRL